MTFFFAVSIKEESFAAKVIGLFKRVSFAFGNWPLSCEKQARCSAEKNNIAKKYFKS